MSRLKFPNLACLFNILSFAMATNVSTSTTRQFCPGMLLDFLPKERPTLFSGDVEDEKQVFHEKEEPFKALFVLDSSLNAKSKRLLVPAFQYVNAKLGPILKARRMVDHRKKQRVCNNHAIPKSNEYDDNKNSYTIVVFVYFSPTNSVFAKQKIVPCSLLNMLAWAMPCMEQDFQHRPTHAAMLFCKQVDDFGLDENQIKELVLHESVHAILGWIVVPTPGNPLIKETIDPENSMVKRGLVVGRNVLKAVRAHFRCQSVEGAELDTVRFINQGYYLPNYGHWNVRLFPDELMSPTILRHKRLSALTLALIQDTGWYKVNFSYAEPLTWSEPHRKADGCDLASQKGKEYIKKQRRQKQQEASLIKPYCDAYSGRCSPDGRLRMECVRDQDFDQCPILLPMLNETADCRQENQILGNELEKFGFRLGVDTICVTFKELPSLTLSYSKFPYPHCVSYECRSPDVVVVKFEPTACPNGKYEYNCDKGQSGQLVEYKPDDECGKTALLGSYRYTGRVQFYCPDYDYVCSTTKSATFEGIDVSPMTLSPIIIAGAISKLSSLTLINGALALLYIAKY